MLTPRSGRSKVIVVGVFLFVVGLAITVASFFEYDSPGSDSGPAGSYSDITSTTATLPPPQTSAAAQNPLPTTVPPPSNIDDLQKHLADCARQLENWRPAQVVYPKSVTVPLDGSASYKASVDIRTGAQAQAPPNATTTVAPVRVQCGLGARLIVLNGSITVEQEREWMFREFDSMALDPGVADWDWNIQATKPGGARVRLELRPAIAARDGGYVVPANDDSEVPTAHFESDINVDAGLIDEATAWFQEDWLKIVAIAAIIGAALVGVTEWGRNFVRSLFGKDSAAPTAAAQPGPQRRRNRRR